MATKAYVLIETAIGKTQTVVERLRKMPGVIAADAVTGPYDVIIVVETKDPNEVGKLVMNSIHGLEGVNHTLTCLTI